MTPKKVLKPKSSALLTSCETKQSQSCVITKESIMEDYRADIIKSIKSRPTLLAYYASTPLMHNQQFWTAFKEPIENEPELTRDLATIYNNLKQGLPTATDELEFIKKSTNTTTDAGFYIGISPNLQQSQSLLMCTIGNTIYITGCPANNNATSPILLQNNMLNTSIKTEPDRPSGKEERCTMLFQSLSDSSIEPQPGCSSDLQINDSFSKHFYKTEINGEPSPLTNLKKSYDPIQDMKSFPIKTESMLSDDRLTVKRSRRHATYLPVRTKNVSTNTNSSIKTGKQIDIFNSLNLAEPRSIKIIIKNKNTKYLPTTSHSVTPQNSSIKIEAEVSKDMQNNSIFTEIHNSKSMQPNVMPNLTKNSFCHINEELESNDDPGPSKKRPKLDNNLDGQKIKPTEEKVTPIKRAPQKRI